MKKRTLIIFITLLGLFILAAIIILVIKNKKTAISEQKKDQLPLPTKQVSLKISSFPIITISPTQKRNTLSIQLINDPHLWQNFTQLNYELMYNSSRGPRGLMGSLTKDNLTEELFLGSESSGHRVYDQGIDKGQLTIYLEDNQGNNLNLGTDDFIVGGYKYLNKWETDSFEFTTSKKSRADFIILLLNNSNSPTSQPAKYILSVRPIKLPLKGIITLKNISDIKEITLNNQRINFKLNPAKKSLTFTIDRGGEYYLR